MILKICHPEQKKFVEHLCFNTHVNSNIQARSRADASKGVGEGDEQGHLPKAPAPDGGPVL